MDHTSPHTEEWRGKARDATVEALESLAAAVKRHREQTRAEVGREGSEGRAGGTLLATVAVLYPVAAAAAIAVVGFLAGRGLA